jgi:hypothetical protein
MGSWHPSERPLHESQPSSRMPQTRHGGRTVSPATRPSAPAARPSAKHHPCRQPRLQTQLQGPSPAEPCPSGRRWPAALRTRASPARPTLHKRLTHISHPTTHQSLTMHATPSLPKPHMRPRPAAQRMCRRSAQPRGLEVLHDALVDGHREVGHGEGLARDLLVQVHVAAAAGEASHGGQARRHPAGRRGVKSTAMQRTGRGLARNGHGLAWQPVAVGRVPQDPMTLRRRQLLTHLRHTRGCKRVEHSPCIPEPKVLIEPLEDYDRKGDSSRRTAWTAPPPARRVPQEARRPCTGRSCGAGWEAGTTRHAHAARVGQHDAHGRAIPVAAAAAVQRTQPQRDRHHRLTFLLRLLTPWLFYNPLSISTDPPILTAIGTTGAGTPCRCSRAPGQRRGAPRTCRPASSETSRACASAPCRIHT